MTWADAAVVDEGLDDCLTVSTPNRDTTLMSRGCVSATLPRGVEAGVGRIGRVPSLRKRPA
jgi:hypothetical protein